MKYELILLIGNGLFLIGEGGMKVNAIETMQGLLFERLEIYVPQEEIAVEGVQLYADEIDEAIVPSKMLSNRF